MGDYITLSKDFSTYKYSFQTYTNKKMTKFYQLAVAEFPINN